MKNLLMHPFVRFFIFCFWAAVIVIFLFLPTIGSYFKKEKSLTIFSWPSLLDPVYLKNFEKETGIKLSITYFENGPALLSKVFATQGRGYDLIIPDDHSLELLIQKGLVKKIDSSKLNFYDQLNPELLGHYADPNNEYSIPYYWGIYGIGYNADSFAGSKLDDTWGVLFDPVLNQGNRVCMTDDPREAILITAQYLFGTIDALKNPESREKVKQALIQQKKFIEVYTISRSDSLLQSKSCGLAVIMSPELWRLAREHPNFNMIVPREGSFVVIDSMAIPAVSDKDEMIYQFLNYLYSHDVMHHHIENFGYCSPLSTVQIPDQENFCPIKRFKEFDFLRNVISDEEINAMWIEVLAA